MVQAQYFSERTDAEKLLLRALIISLLIHLAVFGTWRWGGTEGWWRNFKLPGLDALDAKVAHARDGQKIALVQKPQPQPSQLVFVDVDPALAEAAPPKAPKFYSANNSVAANPNPKNELVPEIRGRQDKVIKTTEDTRLKPQPLQPSPPRQETANTPEAKPLPKKADAPGDLAWPNRARKRRKRTANRKRKWAPKRNRSRSINARAPLPKRWPNAACSARNHGRKAASNGSKWIRPSMR